MKRSLRQAPNYFLPLAAAFVLYSILALCGRDVFASAQSTHDSASKALIGVWDVAYVGVDARDQAHWFYRKDDPRLLGRELVITAQSLTINDGSQPCLNPNWTMKSTSWKELIGKSFERSQSHGISTQPTPDDFGIKKSNDQRVDVYWPSCEKNKNKRVPAPWNETWFAYDGKTLTMKVSTTALLSLRKRSVTEKPKSSFPCDKAQNPAERQICKSISLSALDRSVSSAWHIAMNKHQKNLSKLRTEQAAWLKERDACGEDASCLEREMLERVDALMQE